MKILLGLVIGCAISNVNGFVIPSFSASLGTKSLKPVDRFARLRRFFQPPVALQLGARSPQAVTETVSTDTAALINLSTIEGTAVFTSTTPTEQTAVLTDTSSTSSVTVVIAPPIITTIQPAAQTAVDEGSTVFVTPPPIIQQSTLTVTKTVIALVTSAVDGQQDDAFGGQAGQEPSSEAASAGAMVPVGSGAFGGVVGAVYVTQNDGTTYTTTVGGQITASASTVGVGAFGGVVGSQAFPTNLVSTASSFSGFGGIVGLVTDSAEEISLAPSAGGYRKRDTFATDVSISGGVMSISIASVSDSFNTDVGDGATGTTTVIETITATITASVANTTSSTSNEEDDNGTLVINVTKTAVVNVTSTVFAPAVATTDSNAAAPIPTSLSTSAVNGNLSTTPSTTSTSAAVDAPGPDIVTAVVTATFTIASPTTNPTALPAISLSDIFPTCQNITSDPSVENITMPDILLPSGLTLGQVLTFFGGTADCAELQQLLGVNETNSSSLRRRQFDAVKAKLY